MIDVPCLHNERVEDLAVDFVGVPLDLICQACRSKKNGERQRSPRACETVVISRANSGDIDSLTYPG